MELQLPIEPLKWLIKLPIEPLIWLIKIPTDRYDQNDKNLITKFIKTFSLGSGFCGINLLN